MWFSIIATKLGLSRGGESLEGTLHFLFTMILGASLLRVAVKLIFGI